VVAPLELEELVVAPLELEEVPAVAPPDPALEALAVAPPVPVTVALAVEPPLPEDAFPGDPQAPSSPSSEAAPRKASWRRGPWFILAV